MLGCVVRITAETVSLIFNAAEPSVERAFNHILQTHTVMTRPTGLQQDCEFKRYIDLSALHQPHNDTEGALCYAS